MFNDSKQLLRLLVALAATLALAACGDDDNGGPDGDAGTDVVDTGDAGTDVPDGGDDTSDTADTADTADAADTADTADTTDVADAADVADATDTDAAEVDAGDVTAPEITSFLLTEATVNVLTAIAEVETDEETTLRIDVVESESGETWGWGFDELATSHEELVLGFWPETDFEVTVTVTDAAGNEASQTETFSAAALPEDWPPMTVDVSEPDSMTPGFTLFTVFRWNPELDNDWGLMVVVDEQGRVRWYLKPGHRFDDARVYPDGSIVTIRPDDAIRIWNWAGDLVAEWEAVEDLGVDTLHHEAFPMPNGHIVALSTELRTITTEDCPDYEADTAVVGDVIVEIDPDNDEVVDSWSTFELLDPCVTRDDFATGFWNPRYSDDAPDGTADWTHGNGVIYVEADDSFVVSLRHMDSVFKFSRETGEVVWDIGPESELALGEGSRWPFHTHAPQLTGEDRYMIYDNGNRREDLGDDETDFTRAVEYQLDTSADDPGEWTIDEVWSYEGTERYFAPFVGDANLLGDTVLICDGGLVAQPDVGLGVPENQKSLRIREVTYDDDPQVVFEINIEDPADEDWVSYSGYRAVRIPAFGDADDE